MIEVSIAGIGAVSPAGWGVSPLLTALTTGQPPPTSGLSRPGWEQPLVVRRVPSPPGRLALLGHPRLRRASAISRFAVAAAFEALGRGLEEAPGPVLAPDRWGLVFCTMTGSVEYSRRFFEQVRIDPAMASPLLFPETVFNAPASHVAALLGLSGRVHTEIGDATCVFGGLQTAALWLETGAVDTCLLLAAEESDWLAGDGLSLRYPHSITAEGAGALLVCRTDDPRGLARCRLNGVDGGGGTTARTSGAAQRSGRYPVGPVLGEAWSAGTSWQWIASVAAIAAGALELGEGVTPDTFGRECRVCFESPRGNAA